MVSKGELIEKLFERAIGVINKEVDLDKFKSEWFPNDNRVLWLNIKGMEGLNTGWYVKDGRLHTVNKLKNKPTVTITITEEAFLAIAMGDISLSEAYMYNEIDFEGDEWARDYKIFRRMMEKYKYLLDRISGKGKGGK